MENQKQIYTEVYTMLSMLPSKYINLIPQNIKNEFYTNADTSYCYSIDELLPESKAILIEIIRRYFNEKEITQKIEEYINFNIQIIEKQKGEYQPNSIFKAKETTTIQNQELSIIEYKKFSILEKIKKFIKNIFK